MSRVLVAMSGGVDSSVAAALMQREGHEVIGATMTLAPSHAEPTPAARGCCSLWDVHDAEKVCWRLGIPHYVFNLREEFARHVIGDFLEEYACGRTPNPCSRCNSLIKFDAFLERARMLGAEQIVTGHHARLRLDRGSGRTRLLRGRDARKDQSYFLAGLRPYQLAAARFPIGEFSKERVRQIARELGLGVADKTESQDLCFVPDGDAARFLRRHLGPGRPGPIVDQRGALLGTHPGLQYFTVGQRKGLGVFGPRPLYALELDGARNTLLVGEAEGLLHREMDVGEVNWLVDEPARRARVQFRSASSGGLATLSRLDDCGVRVRFDGHQRALCPGQAAVFYRRDEVLGGGMIARVERPPEP